MAQRSYRNCQSCGMPMNRDDEGGGTNADGSRSSVYCSHCFEAGKFTLPDITAPAMRARVQEKLKEHGFPGFAAALMTRGIPKLQRWR
jgi:hypothetical protein